MRIVIRCAAAYTDCCTNGTRSELRSNSLISQRGHKSLLEYVDEVEAKHLIDSADCNVCFTFVFLYHLLYLFESQSILSLINLSNMSVPFSPLNGHTLVATKNRSTDEATREGEPKSLNNSIDETNTKESEEQRGENENATVYVSRNPSYLSLSTCNYDQTLIDYLQSHPLTKTMTNLAADDNVFERENGQNAAEVNAGRRLFHCTTPVRNCDPRTRTCSTPKLTRAAQKEAEKVKTSLSELLELNLPRDCLISPMYTPDELLRELPTCRFISCHLDPLLDDTITFAKKPRNAGVRVAGFNERRVHEVYGSTPNCLQLLRPNTTILIKAIDYVSKLQVLCL
ncbi:hypothetical protein M3Y98_00466100 [Aphelenchoides besseyi]|nr:hypothetical protein M3Y98_00466100 [Aphelenchoides besseyi]